MISDERKKTLDSASEIYLWVFIETLGGFIWRMNHDLADGRIDSTPGIEKDLVKMQEEVEYSVGQLKRFGIEDPRGEDRDKYWEWYKMWKKKIESLSDADYHAMDKKLQADNSDPCLEFSPYGIVKDMFFGKKLREVRTKAAIGLRNFAEKLEILVSELSNIEHGYVNHGGKIFLARVKITLGEDLSFEDFTEMYKLMEAPFVMKKMPEFGVPFHATKTDGTCATPEELKDMTEHINARSEEHNKKAEEYNKEHGVC